LIDIRRSKASGVTSSSCATSAIPALAIMTSTLPSSRTVSATMESTWAGSLTSASITVARRPSLRTSSATASASECIDGRSAIAMSSPSDARRRAMPRPIPRAPPVMSVTRVA
jgi:hypothetical protein